MTEEIETYSVGCAVWYQLSGPAVYKGLWWPCKVISTDEDGIEISSFVDHYEYSIKASMHPKKIRPFNCAESNSLVTGGMKKLQKRENMLKDYRTAVEEGLEFYRKTEDDPTFTLDFDCNLSTSVSSNSSTPFATLHTSKNSSFSTPNSTQFATPMTSNSPSFATPKGGLDFLNSSIFTTGTCTDPSSLRTSPRSSAKRQRSEDSLSKQYRDPLQPHSPDRKRGATKKKFAAKGENNDRDDVITKLSFDDSSRPIRHLKKYLSRKRRLASRDNEDPRTSQNFATSANRVRSVSVEKEETTVDRLSPAHVQKSIESETSKVTEQYSRPSIGSVEGVGAETTKPSSPAPLGACSVAESMTSDLSYIAPGYDTMLRNIRHSSSSESDDVSYSDSESEDDLPAVDFTVKENIKLHDLKENGVIWAKFGPSPYWPAIVIKVKKKSKKSKSCIHVRFFGYNDLDQSVKINNHEKVAVFATKRAEQFKREGLQYKDKAQFAQAMEDAEKLIRLRAGGRIEGTPDTQYKEITTNRPITYNPNVGESPMVAASRICSVERAFMPTSALGSQDSVSRSQDSDSEQCHISSSEGEELNEDCQYNHGRVMDIVKSIESDLVAIAKGEVESRRHTVSVSGSDKQKHALRREGTFGPLKKWTNGKRVDFVDHLGRMIGKPHHQPLQCRVKDGRVHNDYILGVLLPEAMIRAMMSVEGLSYEEAEQKL